MGTPMALGKTIEKPPIWGFWRLRIYPATPGSPNHHSAKPNRPTVSRCPGGILAARVVKRVGKLVELSELLRQAVSEALHFLEDLLATCKAQASRVCRYGQISQLFKKWKTVDHLDQSSSRAQVHGGIPQNIVRTDPEIEQRCCLQYVRTKTRFLQAIATQEILRRESAKYNMSNTPEFARCSKKLWLCLTPPTLSSRTS